MSTKFTKHILLIGISAFLATCCPPAYSQTSPYTDGASKEVLTVTEESSKLHQAKDYQAAETKLKALIEKLDKQKTAKPVDLALATGNLAALLKDNNKPEEAIPYAQRCLAIDKKRFKEPSILVAEDIKLVADCCFGAKKFEESAKAYTDTIQIAEKASESDYFPCIVAAFANSARKKQLILDSYTGVAKSNFQPGQEEAADAFFAKSIAETMEAPDSAYRHPRARILFKNYGDFLKSTKQTEKLAKLDQDIKEYEKKIQVNRDWTYDKLDFD